MSAVSALLLDYLKQEKLIFQKNSNLSCKLFAVAHRQIISHRALICLLPQSVFIVCGYEPWCYQPELRKICVTGLILSCNFQNFLQGA